MAASYPFIPIQIIPAQCMAKIYHPASTKGQEILPENSMQTLAIGKNMAGVLASSRFY